MVDVCPDDHRPRSPPTAFDRRNDALTQSDTLISYYTNLGFSSLCSQTDKSSPKLCYKHKVRQLHIESLVHFDFSVC